VRFVSHNKSLGLVGSDLHLYVFAPHAPHGNYSGYGFHLRMRWGGCWRHLLLKLHTKGRSNPRSRQYEVCTWRSKRPTSEKGTRPGQRLGFKSYVRLKVSPGALKPFEAEEGSGG
jgi:hypothetical protein